MFWTRLVIMCCLLHHTMSHTGSHLHLLQSACSHLEIWHLTLNMLVLWSFAPTFLCMYIVSLFPLFSLDWLFSTILIWSLSLKQSKTGLWEEKSHLICYFLFISGTIGDRVSSFNPWLYYLTAGSITLIDREHKTEHAKCNLHFWLKVLAFVMELKAWVQCFSNS